MIIDFFITVITLTANQLMAVLGLFFVLGFLLHYLERATEKIYMSVWGWKSILWTGWIGTPVHEISHLIMAKLFRHQVTDVSLFRPDPATGRLGHVSHSYNPRSLYQQLGNFFIGAAPLIGGSVLLMILLYSFIPEAQNIFQPLTTETATITDIARALLSLLFSPDRVTEPKFWLFVYLSVAIVSHVAPSRADLGSMWRGFLWLVLVLIIINGIATALGRDITDYILYSRQYTGILSAIFAYAVVVALFHYIIAGLCLAPFRRRY